MKKDSASTFSYLVHELKYESVRKTYNDENDNTLKSLNSNMKVVEANGDEMIVENEYGVRFKVTGSGITKRITRLFTKQDVDCIDKTHPPVDES